MSKNNYIISITFFIIGVLNCFGVTNINDYMVFLWSLSALFFTIESCYVKQPKIRFILISIAYICLFCLPFFKLEIFEFIGINTNSLIILTIAFNLLAKAKNSDEQC